MVALPGIVVGDHGSCDVWDHSERSKCEHLLHDVSGKLFNLFSGEMMESAA